MTVRIATRRSALAQAQAGLVGRLVTERAGADFELVPMATSGDLAPNRAIDRFDTKGLFVDTVRRAVLDGDCDLVVHSYKDLPTEPVEGLTLGAVPVREDPRDLLVSRDGYAFANVPALATVGTSSQRRKLQLLKVKPGLQVLPLRGNLDTRLRKVADGELDAVVVAFAGLRRLYPDGTDLPLRAVALEPGECLPAAAQGALAIECRAGDDDALALCRLLDDRPTRRQVTAERAFLAAVGGGCLAPVGALASLTGIGGPGEGTQLRLAGMLADPVNRRVLRLSLTGSYDKPEQLGRDLAADLLAAGGDAMAAAIAGLRTGS